jgi:hypothetical protein
MPRAWPIAPSCRQGNGITSRHAGSRAPCRRRRLRSRQARAGRRLALFVNRLVARCVASVASCLLSETRCHKSITSAKRDMGENPGAFASNLFKMCGERFGFVKPPVD